MKTLGDLKAWLLRIKGVESLVAELHAIGHADDQPLDDEHLERIDRELHPREPDDEEEAKTDGTALTVSKAADQPGPSTSIVDADTAQPSPTDQGGTPPGENDAATAAAPSPPTLTDEAKPQ